jgi:hypothetical protein
MAKKETSERIEIIEMRKGLVRFCVLGVTPLICEAMSLKAKQELALPGRKKTKAEKATTLKHDPVKEFRDSVYETQSPEAPTMLAANAMWFKAAMTSAAIDVPGATKAEMGRLTYVQGEMLPLYGAPKMLASVVRCADINRTPDLRFRAILPEWACVVSVQFVTPQVNERAVTNLSAWAGTIRGVGGWRVQKGGSYGQFQLVKPDHPDFVRIMETQARAVQVQCMEEALPYDLETRRLLEYFREQAADRELVMT